MVHIFDFLTDVCLHETTEIFFCLLSLSQVLTPPSWTQQKFWEENQRQGKVTIYYIWELYRLQSHKPKELFKTWLVSSYLITISLSVPGPISHTCWCSADDTREESGHLSLLIWAEVVHLQNLAFLDIFASVALWGL